MEGNSFLNSFMPTLPWWFLVITLGGLGTWVTANRVRLWHARQRQIVAPVSKLERANRALEEVIADPFMSKPTRDRAIEAHDAIYDVITRERHT